MNTYTLSSIPSDVAAYLSGLFDGEGNAGVLTLRRHHDGDRWRYDTTVPYLQLKMTDPEPVELLHEFLGGSLSRYAIKSGKIVHVWRVSHRKAQAAAAVLIPHSRNLSKQLQLRKVLEHYDPKE